MVVSTTASGRPSSRTVLLKEVNAGGFVFFTNYASRKASEMAGSSYVALLFGWYPLHRQVRVEGRAEQVARSNPRHTSRAAPRPSARRLGVVAVERSDSRRADRVVPARLMSALRERTCPARSTGVATGFARRASSSGRVSPAECTTGYCTTGR